MVDTETLGKLLTARGFEPNEDFKALVVSIRETKECGLQYSYYDYRGTSAHRDNWWPASTVKIFAAVAALEKLRHQGFSPRAKLTFHYEEEKLGDVSLSVEKLVRKTITPSDNTSFDRLVEIVGYEALNGRFFTAEKGLGATVLQRGYGGRHRYQDSGRGSLRHSPRITIREGKRKKVLRTRLSTRTYSCPKQGNCTSLLDLAECIRRIMLHELLPESERFRLGPKEIELMRSALSGRRKRGMGVVNGIREALGDREVTFHNKPGYALKWFSDNVFVHDVSFHRRWIVVMAGRPGRSALDEAARHVGALLAEGAL